MKSLSPLADALARAAAPAETSESVINRQLPAYKSHKTVWALKIAGITLLSGDNVSLSYGAAITPAENGYGQFTVDGEYLAKHNPEVGGYWVQYADGYQSYSPAQAFEDGYTTLVSTTPLEPVRTVYGHEVNPVNDTLTISVLDQPGCGGAHHHYMVTTPDWTRNPDGSGAKGVWDIQFQNGPIAEAGVNGLTHEALLAIVADRLRSFQKGPYSCKGNSCALTHIEEAQHWLQQRTIERMRRGVEGTHTV